MSAKTISLLQILKLKQESLNNFPKVSELEVHPGNQTPGLCSQLSFLLFANDNDGAMMVVIGGEGNTAL